jgi:hypothetical protein
MVRQAHHERFTITYTQDIFVSYAHPELVEGSPLAMSFWSVAKNLRVVLYLIPLPPEKSLSRLPLLK